MDERIITCDECKKILRREINGVSKEGYSFISINKIHETTQNKYIYFILEEGVFCGIKCLSDFLIKALKGIYVTEVKKEVSNG